MIGHMPGGFVADLPVGGLVAGPVGGFGVVTAVALVVLSALAASPSTLLRLCRYVRPLRAPVNGPYLDLFPLVSRGKERSSGFTGFDSEPTAPLPLPRTRT